MSTQALKIYRETAMPASVEAYSIYMIAPADRPDYVEIYVTGSAGEIKRVINSADIATLVQAQVSAATELLIVDNIPARDALSLTATRYVYVRDATLDTTVASGGATYLCDPNGSPTNWIKVSEAESIDVALSWASIFDKPVSTVAELDDAVAKRHAHGNKTQLDKVDEDASGNMTYAGGLPHAGWDSTGW